MKSKVTILLIGFLLPLISVAQVNLESGLLARYELNNSGADLGPLENHLQIFGSLTSFSDRFGNPEGAIFLDASTFTYYQCTTAGSSLNPTEVSVSAWVNLSNPNTDQKVAGKATVAQGGYLLGVHLGKVDVEVWNSSGGTLRLKAGSVPANTWTHIGFTYGSASHLKVYVNGVAVDSLPSSPGQLGSSIYAFTLGGAPWEPDALNLGGGLDDVRVYDRPLTGGEMMALYAFVPTGNAKTRFNETVRVFPQPAVNGEVRLENLSAGTVKGVIFDGLGRRQSEFSIPEMGQRVLNSSGWPTGVYRMELISNGRRYFRNLVVQP